MRRRAAAGLVAVLVAAGCTTGHAFPPSAAPPRPIRWLAAGDSYSSGQGAPGSASTCHRSPGARDALAEAEVAAEVEVATFEPVACSGAKVDDVRRQVLDASAAAGGGRFNLVTLTAGGNDLGFSGVLSDCAGGDAIFDSVVHGHGTCDVTEDRLRARVDDLRPGLVALYRDVRDELAPGGTLVVVGYPRLFADPGQWPDSSCNRIAAGDAAMLDRVADALDAAVRGAAEEAGARYLSVIDAFADHGLCGRAEPWLHGLSIDFGLGGVSVVGDSFHPDEAGWKAEASLLAAAVDDLYRAG